MNQRVVGALVFALCMCMCASAALNAQTEAEYQAEFTAWTHKYGKSYSAVDFQRKYNVWKTHYTDAVAHNANSGRYQKGLNAFSDLTWEEFSATHLGEISSTAITPAAPSPATVNPAAAAHAAPTPESSHRDKRSCSSGYAQCGSGCCPTASNYGCVSGQCEMCSTGYIFCGGGCCPSGTTCTASHQCLSCGSGYTACSTGVCCPSPTTCTATGCSGAELSTGSPLAPTVNWTAQGYVTPVKNQGQCGSCWAFSSTGVMEATWNMKHGLKGASNVVLSEQNLLDCSSGYGNAGCNGGVVSYAMNYVEANGGIDTNAAYPLTSSSTGTTGTCKYTASGKGASILSYGATIVGNEVDLQNKVAIAPVSVAIYATASFQAYVGGIYDDSSCLTGSSAKPYINHAVLIVGYGTDSSGGAYWIVKNSWGTSWGMYGYFLLQKGTDRCGVTQQTVYVTSA